MLDGTNSRVEYLLVLGTRPGHLKCLGRSESYSECPKNLELRFHFFWNSISIRIDFNSIQTLTKLLQTHFNYVQHDLDLHFVNLPKVRYITRWGAQIRGEGMEFFLFNVPCSVCFIWFNLGLVVGD